METREYLEKVMQDYNQNSKDRRISKKRGRALIEQREKEGVDRKKNHREKKKKTQKRQQKKRRK